MTDRELQPTHDVQAHGVMVLVTGLRDNTNHVRGRARRFLVRLLAVPAGHDLAGVGLAVGVPLHHQARQAGFGDRMPI